MPVAVRHQSDTDTKHQKDLLAPRQCQPQRQYLHLKVGASAVLATATTTTTVAVRCLCLSSCPSRTGETREREREMALNVKAATRSALESRCLAHSHSPLHCALTHSLRFVASALTYLSTKLGHPSHALPLRRVGDARVIPNPNSGVGGLAARTRQLYDSNT